MNIIERAGRQLGLKPSKSLVERAADHLSGAALSDGETAKASAGVSGPEAVRIVRPRRETPQQIEIDFDRLRKMGFALPGEQSPLAEQFRLIKRPLLSAAFSCSQTPPSRNANVIMVTSANPGEGKTFVATNLAFSMASEHDLHVLLIDADFPNPAVPRVLGFEASTGLVDVVSDSSIDLADALIRTNIDNLTLLASGPTRPGSSELLASARMARFVDEISARYPDRITIFDSPPVLARSEPIILSKHVGQVVIVMEAERTSRTALDETIELIGSDRIAGVVLNKAPAVGREQFGSYYGIYGH